MAKYGTKLTTVGIAKLANAQVSSSKVQITHIAVGDGNGVAYTPTGAETALKREQWRGTVNKAELGEGNTIIVEGIVPATAGGFTMREVGLYDADGAMIAIGNYPDTEKTTVASGVAGELILRTIIKVANTSAVDLTINPDVVTATKSDIDGISAQLAQIEVNAEQFGYLGDAQDSAIAIQAAIDYAFDNNFKTVKLPFRRCLIENTIYVKFGIELKGNSTTLFNNDTSMTLVDMDSYSSLKGVSLEGNGMDPVDYRGIGVNIRGLGIDSKKANITLEKIKIRNMSGYAIFSEFSSFIELKDFEFSNLGYCGFMGMSVNDVKIEKGVIDNINTTPTNTYGVAFSLKQPINLVTNPQSIDCYVDNVVVKNAAKWEGFDTHSGININFSNCIAENTMIGFAVVSADTSSVDNIPPESCTISNCVVIGRNERSGIVVSGASNIVGEDGYAKNCSVINNVIKNGGTRGNNIDGAIRVTNTQGINISGNKVINATPHGIVLGSFNLGFSVNNNTVVDPHDNTITEASSLRILNGNKGIIQGNAFLRVDPSLDTYVNQRGINTTTSTSDAVDTDIFIGDNFIESVIPMANVKSPGFKTGTLGVNAKTLFGTGNPEGSLTASTGSEFVNQSGGLAGARYLKFSGSGNTGWAAIKLLRATTSSGRPTGMPVGSDVFDTNLGKPIWWDGTNWVDATGTTV